MGTKLFVVSDIHGHYTELIEALSKAGFDKDNPAHYLVCCGDLFDRGTENHLVYEFIKGLKHKFLIKGNHEDMLYTALQKGIVTENNINNGMGITLYQLFGNNIVNASGYINKLDYKGKIYEIQRFIENMRDYYEAGKYIFVHGWLPIKWVDNQPVLNESWRHAKDEDWVNARWLEWPQCYYKKLTIEDKIIVCGHRSTHMACHFDESRASNCYDSFHGDGMIAIDGCTFVSGQVNVLVLEPFDEE